MSRTSDRSLPTSKDVAALAGVSQSTVSYVLSGKRSISAETKRRVEAAIAQLTYQPNAGARALRGRRTNVIALVARLSQATDVTDTIPYIDTVVEQARERDFDVVLVTAGQGPDELIRLAKRSICDGIVLMDIRAQDARVATAAGLGLPVVLIGTPDDGHGLHAVDIDARRAGELLAAELAETGHRHLVVVGEAPEVRRAGFPFIGEFHDGAVGVASARGLDLRVVHPPRPGWEGLKEMAEALFGQAGDRLGVIARTPQAIGWVLQLAVLRGCSPGGTSRWWGSAPTRRRSATACPSPTCLPNHAGRSGWRCPSCSTSSMGPGDGHDPPRPPAAQPDPAGQHGGVRRRVALAGLRSPDRGDVR